MAKKIHAMDAEVGKLYLIKGSVYVALGWSGNIYDFQRLGGPERHGCGSHQKVRPINLFTFFK